MDLKWYMIMMAVVIGGPWLFQAMSDAPTKCAESCKTAGLTMTRASLLECACGEVRR